MPKITPFLWFDGTAEEATTFYVSIFKNSKVKNISRSGESGPGVAGTVFSTSFVLDGQEFHALNGGPMFKFTEAVSFFINCESQEEIDYFWEKLSEGGEIQMCGWLKDKFGVSWQVVPHVMSTLLGDADGKKTKRVMDALLKMNKIVIADLQRAFDDED